MLLFFFSLVFLWRVNSVVFVHVYRKHEKGDVCLYCVCFSLSFCAESTLAFFFFLVFVFFSHALFYLLFFFLLVLLDVAVKLQDIGNECVIVFFFFCGKTCIFFSDRHRCSSHWYIRKKKNAKKWKVDLAASHGNDVWVWILRKRTTRTRLRWRASVFFFFAAVALHCFSLYGRIATHDQLRKEGLKKKKRGLDEDWPFFFPPLIIAVIQPLFSCQ